MKINTRSHSFLKLKSKIAISTLLTFGLRDISSSRLLQAATKTIQPQFHVKDHWNIGGKGGWGFLVLDASANRLYIPRTNRVTVVDTNTGKVIGEVEEMKNIRDIALDDSGKYGYVTDPTDGSEGFVRVFDRDNLKMIASVPTGAVPAAIVFDSFTKSVLAFNSRGRSATIIDTTTNQVSTTIPLSGRPGSAVADGNGIVFVSLPATGEILRIDAAARKVTTSWQLAPCAGPRSLALDKADHLLFTTCENRKLVTVDVETGHVTEVADVSSSSGNIDYDATHKLLFVADAGGTLLIYRRDSPLRYSCVQQVKTQPGARTMIVSHNDSKAYLVTSQFGQNTAPVSEELQFRPTPIPGTFSVIVVGR
jgi:YVTN family beta-propeller protein